MRFIVESHELDSALRLLVPTAAQSKLIPILTYVMVEASCLSIKLTAASPWQRVKALIPAKVSDPGSACLPAKKLAEIAAVLDGEVTIEVNARGAIVACGTSTFEIGALGTEDFPPHQKADGSLSPLPPALVESMSRVRHAVYAGEAREQLAGIHLVASGEQVMCEATDAHRLAVCEASGALGGLEATKDRGVLVPLAGANEVLRAHGASPGEEWKAGIRGPYLEVARPGYSLSVLLSEAEFPDVSAAIPPACEAPTFDAGDLCQALRRAILVAGDSREVSLSPCEAGLRIESKSDDGSAVETVATISGNVAASVNANARYVMEAIGDFEQVRIDIGDAESPLAIRPVEESGYVAIIMPMRS
jgi:DNA polymerase-3 subunit beta